MAELVQVRFTLRLRDQRSMWMQDGCKDYVKSYMASNGSCFMVTWTILKNNPLGSRPNTKPGDNGTPNTHSRWFILFYHMWGPAWIEVHWNSIWLKARSRMTSHYTRGSVTEVHDFGDVLRRPLHTFFWALTIHGSRLLGPSNTHTRTRTQVGLMYLVMSVGTAITKRDLILRGFRRSRHRTCQMSPCPSRPVGVAISYDVDYHLGGALLGFTRCEDRV